MFELKHGKVINEQLIEEFSNLGYQSYVLVNSLGALRPFNNEQVDGFDLNLFCCKPDTAKALADRNLLIETNNSNTKTDALTSSAAADYFKGARALRADAAKLNGNSLPSDYLQALNLYCAIHKPCTISEKFSLMKDSMLKMERLLSVEPDNLAYMSTYARVGLSIGQRAKAVKALWRLVSEIEKNGLTNDLPALSASANFDRYPMPNQSNRLLAAAMHSYILNHAFSTYYSKTHVLPLLNSLQKIVPLDDRMQDRKNAIIARQKSFS